MKIQYLGDSKDLFKWSYLDLLVTELDYSLINYIPMLTENDNTNEGKTKSFKFENCYIDFCNKLKKESNIDLIKELPVFLKKDYQIKIYNNSYFSNQNRTKYLKGIKNEIGNQILFFDPDNGFQAKNTSSNKHLQFTDVLYISEKIKENDIIVVFHHFRRLSFNKDFEYINKHLPSNLFINGIYWNGKVMFIAICKNRNLNNKINEINNLYIERNNKLTFTNNAYKK